MLFQFPLHVATGVFFFDAFALVVEFLASSQIDEQFGASLGIDEEFDGDDGEATFFDFYLQFVQFAAVEEEFAVAFGGMVEIGAEAIFGDVHLADEQFVAYEGAIGIGKVGFAVADGFDFGAGEDNASGIVVEQKVFVFSPFVFDFDDIFFFHIRVTEKFVFYWMEWVWFFCLSSIS